MVKLLVGPRKNKDGSTTHLNMYYDGILKREQEEVKKVVTSRDMDYVALVTGRVGKGKSVFAQQQAKFYDKSFDLSRVVFSAEKFIEVTTTCPQFSAVVLDEAFLDMNTQASRSPSFLKVLNHLNIIRKRNLFIFILLPDFFDLHQSIALIRSEHLFYIYGEGFGGRGRFLAFGPDNKRMLYILGKKYHNINAYRSNFKGVFTGKRAVDEDLYEEKKDKALYSKNIMIKKFDLREIMFISANAFMKIELGYSQKKRAEIFTVSHQKISKLDIKYGDVYLKVLQSTNKYDIYTLIKDI